MTVPFNPDMEKYTPYVWPPVPAAPVSAPVSDKDPFREFVPKRKTGLIAVQVSKANIHSIAWRVLKNTEMAVWVPTGRSCIQIGDKRFDAGEWIVEEHSETTKIYIYRHPTEDEEKSYGLTNGELKG